MSIAKKIIIDELNEQPHPEKVEDVIFWALDHYSKSEPKGTWGRTIAYAIKERILEEENNLKNESKELILKKNQMLNIDQKSLLEKVENAKKALENLQKALSKIKTQKDNTFLGEIDLLNLKAKFKLDYKQDNDKINELRDAFITQELVSLSIVDNKNRVKISSENLLLECISFDSMTGLSEFTFRIFGAYQIEK